MSSIRDVAKDCGVSIATVSRYLNNDPSLSIKNETRKRIDDSVKKLGYKFSSRKKQYSFGCIMSLTYTYYDPFFTEILAGVQDYCQANNCIIAMIISYEQSRNLSPAVEKKIQELDGLLVTDATVSNIDRLKKLNSNLVFVDCYINNSTVVGFDHYHANLIMINHLLDAGYKNIAYIGGDSNGDDVEHCVRTIVLREALRNRNIPYRSEYIYDCHWNPGAVKDCIKDIIDNHHEVDAIFAGSDSVAVAVVNELSALGKKCPDDIAVVGFNGNDIAIKHQPSITTMKLPTFQMGQSAARLLHKQAQHQKSYNYQILLPVELLKGETSK